MMTCNHHVRRMRTRLHRHVTKVKVVTMTTTAITGDENTVTEERGIMESIIMSMDMDMGTTIIITMECILDSTMGVTIWEGITQ